MKPHPTLAEWQALLRYDADAGEFFWRVTRSRTVAGSRAGGPNVGGYHRIGYGGERYLVHCLVWLFETGVWPTSELDHQDANQQNNRFGNLRPATTRQNQANAKLRIDNKSGYKGVAWSKAAGKWIASIRVNDRAKHLGTFDDPKKAHEAYAAAAIAHRGEFARV